MREQKKQKEKEGFFAPWTVNTWRYYFSNEQTRYRQPVTITMVAAVVLLFGAAGASKLLWVEPMVERFIEWGYAPWVIPFIGVAELTGAALLLQRRTAVLGASVLGVVMVGALATHLASGEYASALVPLFFTMLLAGIAERAHDKRALRRLDTQTTT